MLIKSILLSCFSLLLFSCAIPYVKEDVEAKNWEALGQHDAENGQVKKSAQYINGLASKYNAGDIDYSAYEQAYQSALDEYCQLDNAFILGLSAKSYLGVCRSYPNGLEFYNLWDAGRRSGSDSRW